MLSLLTHILLFASSSVCIYGVNDDLSALLSFKSYITNDPGQALSSWDASDNGTSAPTSRRPISANGMASPAMIAGTQVVSRPYVCGVQT